MVEANNYGPKFQRFKPHWRDAFPFQGRLGPTSNIEKVYTCVLQRDIKLASLVNPISQWSC